MFRDFFVNFVIIIAFVSLGYLFFRDRTSEIKTRKCPWQVGIIGGVLGCLLMLFSVRVSEDVIVDFRCVAIILMGLYCTMTAAVTSAVIIALFRIFVFGFSRAALLAGIVLLLGAVACSLIGKTKHPWWLKWLLAYFSVSFLAGTGFYFGISDRTIVLRICYIFFHSLLVVCTATYFLIEYIRKTNVSYSSVREASNVDFLTGLHNARHFQQKLEENIAYSKRHLCTVSLLYLDVDQFKQINDTFGHLSGDRLLQELSRLLLRLSRQMDTVTRKGGDEFTVLLANCSVKEALEVAERIRQEVEQYNFISNMQEIMKVTVSIGVSSFPETTEDENKLTDQADQALYHAKQLGGNRVVAMGHFS